MNELPNEQFMQLSTLEDFSNGKLYIHMPEDDLCNVKIPTAGSYGVPSLTTKGDEEFVSSGDMIVENRWLQSVKMMMRDHKINSEKVRNASKRMNNLDQLALARKIALQKKGLVKPEPNIRPKAVKRVTIQPEAQTFKKLEFSREPYVAPQIARTTTMPCSQKASQEEVDVSIIIPMYKSREEVVEQILSWDFSEDGLNKEIIYVDDCCPQNSHQFVYPHWDGGNYSHQGKILHLSNNAGFSTACNRGAEHARGRYVIFLNADTTVTPNWVKPMIDLLQEDVGIVGNMQLKGTTIDSAGSEWMWDSKSFEHIGRNVYNGKRISRMITLESAPPDLLVVGERDMVTGCCIAMRKHVFDEVGGFDIDYRIGYWEDSDLNMKVKHKGYKVLFTPDSRIYHKTGHSRASLHPFIMDNTRKFYDKWVESGIIDSLVKAKRP